MQNFKPFHLQDGLLGPSRTALGRWFARNVDQVRALSARGIGCLAPFDAPGMRKAGEQIAFSRIEGMLKRFELHAETPTNHAAKQTNDQSVKDLMVCVDQRASFLLSFSTIQSLQNSKDLLGLSVSQSLCSDVPEMMAMMAWRYGCTHDLQRAFDNSLTPGVRQAIAALQPSLAVKNIIRPHRSRFRITSNHSDAEVANWLKAFAMTDHGLDCVEHEDKVFRVAIDDESRDEFLNRFCAENPHAWVSIDFDSLLSNRPHTAKPADSH